MKRRDWDHIHANVCILCNGMKCRHCGKDAFALNRKGVKTPIYGLHCDWVGDDASILACQRPSSRIIKEFKIIDQFKSNGITSVFNLQEAGEHPHCGDKINKISGFSYFPEEFMDNGIFFFNFAWPDMTAPSLSIIHNCVQVMESQIKRGGKIMVHCHAGLGRTGMMIACLLVYKDKMSSTQAAAIVRRDRLGSIQRESQMKAISDYEWYLKQSNVIYAILPGDKTFTIGQHLDRQNVQLSGSKADILRWTPRLLHISFTKLGKAIIERRLDTARSFISAEGDALWIEREIRLQELKIQLHDGRIDELEKEEDLSVISNLVLDWLEHLNEPLLPEKLLAEAATYLLGHREICWILREEATAETATQEAGERRIALDVIEKAALHTLPISNFRTLTLIISFFRTLLLGKVESEDFTSKDIIMIPAVDLEKVCIRLAVALLHLNPSCVKRCQPPPEAVEAPKDSTDVAIESISKLIGIDLSSPRLFGKGKRSPTTSAVPPAMLQRRNSQIMLSRFFIPDDLNLVKPSYRTYGLLIALLIQNWTTDRKETLETWRLRRDSMNVESDEPLEYLLDEIKERTTSPRPNSVTPPTTSRPISVTPPLTMGGSTSNEIISGRRESKLSEGIMPFPSPKEGLKSEESKFIQEEKGTDNEEKYETSNPFSVESSPSPAILTRNLSRREESKGFNENPFAVDSSKVAVIPVATRKPSIKPDQNPFAS